VLTGRYREKNVSIDRPDTEGDFFAVTDGLAAGRWQITGCEMVRKF
jgi:hypothetical protein